MATKSTVPASDATPRSRILSSIRLIVTLALLALLAVCLTFTWATRDAMAHLPFLRHRTVQQAAQKTHVDLRPWQTAEELTALAVTAEEVAYARDAERLADHEVDQAFASALRQANTRTRSLTDQARRLSLRLAQLQQTVKDDQANIARLTSHPAAITALPGDLDVAKAQLGLDSDELTDTQQDLARAAGDERTAIQQELAAHELAMRKYDAQSHNQHENAVASAGHYNTLAERLGAWFNQRTRYGLLQQAMQQTKEDTTALTAEHTRLQGKASAASAQSAATPSQRDPSASPDVATRLASLKNRSAQQQLMSIYDDRIQTEEQLAAVYDKWSSQVLLQHRIMLHLLLQSFALIAFILLCVIFLDTLAGHFVERPGLDRRRMQSLRVISKLAIQLMGALLILLVVFGAPGQTPTIVGLATAGITVVLQDFIIAFFGWFVLMGKNGIRVGDWVEINGVGGEVVEISVFRTSVLETGNWTDTGHPTGRRVTFMNSFAIKGQYFNFSTSGQWMWDEITVNVPVGDETYATVDRITKAVFEETEKNAKLAEGEWRRATRPNDLAQFTAAPTVNMRPSAAGIDIIVRYVTRASDRFEVRNRLYQCVIGLLHKPLTSRPESEQPAATP